MFFPRAIEIEHAYELSRS